MINDEDPVLDDPMEPLNPVEPTRLEPDQLVDRTFLMPPAPDGSRVRAKIVKRINKYKEGRKDDKDYIKFRCLVNNDYKDVVAYNDIIDYIEQDQTWDGIWKFKSVLNVQGPMTSRHKNYRGSCYNVRVE